MRSSLRALSVTRGIGGVDAVNVRIDVAAVGLERRGQGDGRGVGPTAAQRGDAVPRADALEPRHDGNLPRFSKTAFDFSVVSMSRIRALPWTSSVLKGSCQPNQDRASMPMDCKNDGENPDRHLLTRGHHDVVLSRVVERSGLGNQIRPAGSSHPTWPRQPPRRLRYRRRAPPSRAARRYGCGRGHPTEVPPNFMTMRAIDPTCLLIRA